jgi:plasmid maintenance system antidote protein VapI
MKKQRQKRRPDPENAFVYIVKCCDDNGYIKIGVTRDSAVNRVKTLQVGCPYELKVIASFNVNGVLEEIETLLHTQLKRFHLRGEWFHLDASEAIRFISVSLPLIDKTFVKEPHKENKIPEKITELSNNALVNHMAASVEKGRFTQAKLAELTGVSSAFISQLKTGKKKLSPEMRDKLLQVITPSGPDNVINFDERRKDKTPV